MTSRDDDRTERIDSGAATLWASAMIIIALVIVQAGKVSTGPGAAYADVAKVADLTVLTTRAGDQEDILAVLDGREERLFVYGVLNGRSVELYEVQDLKDLFTQAGGAGRPGR